jgi:hypothetical protein
VLLETSGLPRSSAVSLLAQPHAVCRQAAYAAQMGCMHLVTSNHYQSLHQAATTTKQNNNNKQQQQKIL